MPKPATTTVGPIPAAGTNLLRFRPLRLTRTHTARPTGSQHIQPLSIKQRRFPVKISTRFAQPVVLAAPLPEYDSLVAQPHGQPCSSSCKPLSARPPLASSGEMAQMRNDGGGDGGDGRPQSSSRPPERGGAGPGPAFRFVCLHESCHRHLHPNPRALDAHYKSDHFNWAENDSHLGAALDLDGTQELFTDVDLSHATGFTPDHHMSTPDSAQGPSNTGGSAARHTCPICEASFARKADLDRHAKKHEAPTFFCSFLDCRFNTRGFCRRDKLASHMRQGHKVDYYG